MFVTKCDGFAVYQFVWWAINSNTYVVCGRNSILIVDPIDSEDLYVFLQKKSLRKMLVLLTHEHYDHISGLNKLRIIFPNCCVVSSKACSENIQTPKKNLSIIADAIIEYQERIKQKPELTGFVGRRVKPFSCVPSDKTFEKKMAWEWEGHSLLLTEYTGHSMGSICCIVDGKYMFSGDTLLPLPTVTQLPGGNTARFWEEDMPKLEKLAGQIDVVFPGHEMPGRLEDMLAVNVKPVRYRQSNKNKGTN